MHVALVEERSTTATSRMACRRRLGHLGWRAAAEALAGVLVLTAVAEVLLRALDVSEFLVPMPSAVAHSLYENRALLATHSLVTLREVVIGFGAAAAGGFALAVLMFYVPFLARALYPVLIASQTIPKIALAPLLVVWFGFGLAPKVIVVFLMAFFPVVIATAVGLRSVDENMVHLVRSMGASEWQTFWKVRLPRAVPSIYSGLKIAITLSVVGAIVGEFVGADAGLGYLLLIANGQLDTPLMFAAVLLLSVMGLTLFGAVAVLERVTPGHIRDLTEGSDGLAAMSPTYRSPG